MVTELQRSAQAEAQRRATQSSRLALVLPAHVVDVFTLGKLACERRHCEAFCAELLGSLRISNPTTDYTLFLSKLSNLIITNKKVV